MQIHIVTRNIGDLSNNVEAFFDYKAAYKHAKLLEKETHERGYTDFVFKVNSLNIKDVDSQTILSC